MPLPPSRDQVRTILRFRHYSTARSSHIPIRTSISFVLIKSNTQNHLAHLTLNDFSPNSPLAVSRNVATATQNQALNALNSLYTQVIKQPLGSISGTARTKRPKRLPGVLFRKEIEKILENSTSTEFIG